MQPNWRNSLRLAITFAAITLATAAQAEMLALKVDNFFIKNGIATIAVKLTNNSENDYKIVSVSCAFMSNDERALDVTENIITNVGAGQIAYGTVRTTNSDGVEKASCRVVSAR